MRWTDFGFPPRAQSWSAIPLMTAKSCSCGRSVDRASERRLCERGVRGSGRACSSGADRSVKAPAHKQQPDRSMRRDRGCWSANFIIGSAGFIQRPGRAEMGRSEPERSRSPTATIPPAVPTIPGSVKTDNLSTRSRSSCRTASVWDVLTRALTDNSTAAGSGLATSITLKTWAAGTACTQLQHDASGERPLVVPNRCSTAMPTTRQGTANLWSRQP